MRPEPESAASRQKAARQTGLLPETAIFAGGGDGQCAALGTNCITSDQAYINLGTAVVSGVWSPQCLEQQSLANGNFSDRRGIYPGNLPAFGRFSDQLVCGSVSAGGQKRKRLFQKAGAKGTGYSDRLGRPDYAALLVRRHESALESKWQRLLYRSFRGTYSRPTFIDRFWKGMCLDQAQATSGVGKRNRTAG